jgi:hypothetical protein
MLLEFLVKVLVKELKVILLIIDTLHQVADFILDVHSQWKYAKKEKPQMITIGNKKVACHLYNEKINNKHKSESSLYDFYRKNLFDNFS